MEVKTKFNIGDTVVTVKDCNPVEFTIGIIVVTGNGVMYGTNRYDLSPVKEEYCFVSKEALMEHINNQTVQPA